MVRSTFLPLVALAALVGGVALQPAFGQSTTVTTTTTTKKLGGITSQTTVTEETTVYGEPKNPLEIEPAPPAETSRGDVGRGAGAGLTGAPAASDEVMTSDGIRYACTGVAKDSRDDPRWNDFPAKLVYTVRGGGYLPDVLTRIEDGQGRQVFAMRCDGPWLLVDLPADRYRVVATAEDPQGQVHQRTATLSVGGGGQSEAIIRFNEIPG